jgi:hypothetical protein
MIKAWVNDVNTTSLRIVSSLAIAVVAVPMVLLAMLWFRWEPTALQLKVLIGLAGFVLTMMGFDVLQFVGKRFSDATYAAAKNPSQPVTVETPPPAATDGPAPRVAPASDGVGAPSASAQLAAPVKLPSQLVRPPAEASD